METPTANVHRLSRYMTPIPYTVEPGMSVRVAIELMRRHGIRHLPIEENDRLTGILSDWDILAAPDLERVLDQTVGSIMTPDPYRMTQDATLEAALQTMSREGLGSVLLVDDADRVIGIFTEKDAVRAVAEIAEGGRALTGSARILQ